MSRPEGRSIDPELRQWASPRQIEFIDAVNELGGVRAAAARLGVHHSTIQDSLRNLARTAAKAGYSPDHDMKRPVPDGFQVKGVSTYYDKDGNAAGQWVKSSIDSERQKELFRAAAEALAEELPRLAPLPRPPACREDLLNFYPYTDYHMGMLAWAKEAGEDWDIRIAEKLLVASFEAMIQAAPPAKTAMLGFMGDFLHYDSLEAVTPAHKNLLDADGRFSKMVAASIRVKRRIIDIALLKHEFVVIVEAEGNHDPASAVWLRLMFQALYENEPRVSVNASELPYYAHQFGKTMLVIHHGHLSKNNSLPLLFAAMYPAMWGSTTKRYCHTGHLHHAEEKEHAGMKVMQLPTLSAKDSWAARKGYLSEREVTAFTYHSEFGLVARNIVTPEMVEA